VDAVATIPTNPDLANNISPDPLDTFHAFSLGSLLSPSPECRNMSTVDHHGLLNGNVVDCFEFPGTFRGYNPSLDPYNLYLKNMPRKIMLTIAFNYYDDFSKAFDKEHLPLFQDSCLSALIHIYLSCMLRHLISSCEV